jgi:hypothetical protein
LLVLLDGYLPVASPLKQLKQPSIPPPTLLRPLPDPPDPLLLTLHTLESVLPLPLLLNLPVLFPLVPPILTPQIILLDALEALAIAALAKEMVVLGNQQGKAIDFVGH